MFKTKTAIALGLMLCLLLTSFVPNFAFASTQSPTWGISDPFPAAKIFYNSSKRVSTVYTSSSEVNFSVYHYSNSLDTYKTTVRIQKETKLGSGEYLSPEQGILEFWGAGSGSSVGGYTGGEFVKLKLPGEGRYRVDVCGRTSSGSLVFAQGIYIVYSKRVVERPINVVSHAWTGRSSGKITVNATIHDISGKGIIAKDLMIGLANLEFMEASYGRASMDWAKDITVTRSPNNYDEYYIKATVDPGFFNNRSGFYYIDFYVKTGYDMTNWGRMFGLIYL